MANTTYESLLPDVIPMAPGCPDMLIENAIRSSTIELCEKAGVYKKELDVITTTANIYEYDLEPPSGTAVHKINWVTHKGIDLEPLSTSLLETRKPKWREAAYAGTPEYFVKVTQSLFWLVPVPNVTTTSSTYVHVQLKPTHSSTSCDSDVMNDYRDAIVTGAVFRLLRMPSKDWTDYAGAQAYGTFFLKEVEIADNRARNADTAIARSVKYGGIHKAYSLPRRKYGPKRI